MQPVKIVVALLVMAMIAVLASSWTGAPEEGITTLPEDNETLPEPACGEKGQDCCESDCNEPLECVNGTCKTVLKMFHNNAGPMCLEQLEFLEEAKGEHPYLVVEEYYTYEEGTGELLLEMESRFNESEGFSKKFGYLPITFINGRAFSGFDDQVRESLEELIEGKDLNTTCYINLT